MSLTAQQLIRLEQNGEPLLYNYIPDLRDNAAELIPYYTQYLHDTALETREERMQTGFLTSVFFLAENHVTAAFPDLVHLLCTGSIDFMGDFVTSCLHEVLYHTFNGDCALLEDSIHLSADIFVHSSVFHVLMQLFLDGIISKSHLKSFFQSLVNQGVAHKQDLTMVCYSLSELHWKEAEKMIRFAANSGCVDPYVFSDKQLREIMDKCRVPFPEGKTFCQDYFVMEQCSHLGIGVSETPEKAIVQSRNGHEKQFAALMQPEG